MTVLLTLAELAELLRVPHATIYARRYRGESLPPAIRIGKHLRFDQEDVRLWLAEQKECPR